MKYLLFIFPLFTSLLFLGCPDEKPPIIIPPTPTNCEYQAGNRNFIWRLDTVAWWPSTLGGVWAFSDTDAWVMGNMYGPTVPGQISYVGLHWDGKAWNEKVDFQTILMKPNDVTGDDHYMVAAGYLMFAGIRPAIAEFNNKTKQWQRYDLAQTPGELRSVWTDGKGYFIAVGDSGMVYTKDGYMAGWVYSKAPTDFSFYKLSGVSKNEIYILGYKSVGGTTYPQIWKYDRVNWLKLLDDLDTTGTVLKIQETEHIIGDIYAERCRISDSLKLYIVGWESNLFETIGTSLQFNKTNLSSFGLSLRSIGRTAQRIFGYSPNDYWIFGTGYNYYHWNGSNFQKMNIPGYPTSIDDSGDNRRMIKTSSGKMFFPTEVSSQVYVVIQGVP